MVRLPSSRRHLTQCTQVRVYEVLRSLFSEAQDANPQKLLLSREDLATRFTLSEITPVLQVVVIHECLLQIPCLTSSWLQGIGAFDALTGSFVLKDVFERSQPTSDGTVSLASFLQSCDPEQAAKV